MLKIDYTTKEDINNILCDFKILFAYHSNKIENDEIDYHDTREVFENDKVVGFNGNPRTLFEIQNQKICYEFLIDKLVNREKISVDLIKQIHLVLTNGTYDDARYAKGERPGEYKKGDYIVGEKEVGSSADEVEKQILQLVQEINETKSDDYLTIATYFHLRFETIHPFADGNGRVGRTLMNYYFMINGYKPLIIYDEDKKLYYECLRAFDEKQDIEPLKKFIEYEQEKTWSKKQNINTKLGDYVD